MLTGPNGHYTYEGGYHTPSDSGRSPAKHTDWCTHHAVKRGALSRSLSDTHFAPLG